MQYVIYVIFTRDSVNFYEDFTETGLGLCCEEAARIILTEEEKFSVPIIKDDEFFKQRQEIFDILQNRDVTVLERFKTLAEVLPLCDNIIFYDNENGFVAKINR